MYELWEHWAPLNSEPTLAVPVYHESGISQALCSTKLLFLVNALASLEYSFLDFQFA